MTKALYLLILWVVFFASIPSMAHALLCADNPECSNTATPAFNPEDILVINEIMYNNPGLDDYEFIELYNSGDLVIQLEGYRFTQGVTFTFPAYLLQPGAYVVVAVDSAKFRQAFNVEAFQWSSGQALNNSG